MVRIIGLKLNIVVICSKNQSWADNYNVKIGETHAMDSCLETLTLKWLSMCEPKSVMFG